MDLEESRQKLLNTPELVERILLFLDPSSILQLAESELVKEVILRKGLSLLVWSGLVKQFGDEVKELVEILKILNPKDPKSFLLPLLHSICKEYEYEYAWRPEVEMRCPCQDDPHRISADGFLILEEHVEGVFGTAVQSLISLGNLV